MKLVSATALFFLTAFAAQAQEQPEKTIDQICAERACRDGGYEVAVRINDKNYTTVPVGRSPYITEDGEILIFPGETFAVVLSFDGEKPGVPVFHKAFAAELPALIVEGEKLAGNPLDSSLPKADLHEAGNNLPGLPANALLISYGQADGLPGMSMEVSQNMARTLKLDATMFLITPGDYNPKYTSTCPIIPNGAIYEHWPHEIGPMILSNFRFLKDNDKTTCQ